MVNIVIIEAWHATFWADVSSNVGLVLWQVGGHAVVGVKMVNVLV